MNSVFISYSSKNNTEVCEITKMFDKYGISYWKAPEMISAGSNYAREIPRVITECPVFLLVISSDSQQSVWVEKEIDFAINSKKTIVPLKIEEVELNDMFKFYLNNVQTISYSEGRDEALKKLRERISELINIQLINAAEDKDRVEVEKDRLRQHRARRIMGLNPQPVSCKYCDGELELIRNGVYKCRKCGKENYDYFRTVRNYLEKAGPSSKLEIQKATGVPRASIDYFLRQEQLEIPKNSNIRLRCAKCGAPIRTGYLCDNCK